MTLLPLLLLNTQTSEVCIAHARRPHGDLDLGSWQAEHLCTCFEKPASLSLAEGCLSHKEGERKAETRVQSRWSARRGPRLHLRQNNSLRGQ